MFMYCAASLFLLSGVLVAPGAEPAESEPMLGFHTPLVRQVCELGRTLPPVSTRNPWTFEKASQLWVPLTYHQKAAVSAGSVVKRLGPSGLIRSFQGGGVFHMDARKDRFGISYDMCYGLLKSKTPNTFSPFAAQFNIPVKDEIKCGILVVEGSWRFGEGPLTCDALFGARYLDGIASFSVESATLDIDRGFLEPLTGCILRLRLSDAWELSARAAVSGFGLGSQLTLDLEPRITYALSREVSVFLGFRTMRAHYHEDASALVSIGFGPWRIPNIVYGEYGMDADFRVEGVTAGFLVHW